MSTETETGVQCLTPHLVVTNAPAAIEFYKKAFGAIEQVCLKHPEDGKIIHAALKIGNSTLMLCEEFKEWSSLSPQSLNGTPVTIHLQVENNVDEAFQKALAAGAVEEMPLADMFWGDRYGKLKDPFGHSWSLATKIRDVSPEELMAGAAASCGNN